VLAVSYIVGFLFFGLLSVELGAEFFIAANTALNLITVIYINRTRRDVTNHTARVEREVLPKVEHVNDVASQLDTRVPGGRRAYDIDSKCKDGDS
jgi:hypothetical protein